jgi:hypothetical protein
MRMKKIEATAVLNLINITVQLIVNKIAITILSLQNSKTI